MIYPRVTTAERAAEIEAKLHLKYGAHLMANPRIRCAKMLALAAKDFQAALTQFHNLKFEARSNPALKIALGRAAIALVRFFELGFALGFLSLLTCFP